MATRRLRIDEPRVVRLGSILCAYDGLASLHGDDRDGVVVLTTADRAAELDELLAALAREIGFEVVTDC